MKPLTQHGKSWRAYKQYCKLASVVRGMAQADRAKSSPHVDLFDTSVRFVVRRGPKLKKRLLRWLERQWAFDQLQKTLCTAYGESSGCFRLAF
jgi:hypothetical protein